MMVLEPKRLAWGPHGVDFQERINFARMREERAARTRLKMKEHGIAVAILSGGENIRYASAMRTAVHLPSGRYCLLIFADSDKLIFLAPYEYVVHARERSPWIKPENIRTLPGWLGDAGRASEEYVGKMAADVILQALKENKVDKEKVGLDGLPPTIRGPLESAGIKFAPMKDIMIEARKIKTEDEINCLKMAGVIVERAWWKVYENLKPGISECEISAIGAEVLTRNGAEGPFLVSARSGPNTAPNYLAMVTDRILQVGDLGFADIWGNMYNGYRTCYYRTWKVGSKPTDKEKDWYKQAYEMLCKGQEALKPGVTTADVAKQFPDYRAWGLNSEEEVDGNAECHGLGLGQNEYPTIRRLYSLSYPEPIEEGMVFAVETWMGEKFVGGCRVENVGVVRKGGFENFYAMPDEGIIVPPHSLVVVE